jgi:hypothetical protein
MLHLHGCCLRASSDCQRLCGGRKHARAMEGAGLANAGARLFSNPAGDYGSMVNERVGAGARPRLHKRGMTHTVDTSWFSVDAVVAAVCTGRTLAALRSAAAMCM